MVDSLVSLASTRLKSTREDFSLGYIAKVASLAQKFSWIRREWKPVDIVVDNERGGISFDISVADGKRYQLQPGGWKKEPCAICDWEIANGRGRIHEGTAVDLR